MKQRFFPYVLLAIVFGVSLWAALLAQKAEALSILFAAPGVAALFGVLLQLARDQAASERAQHLQRDQQIFNLGAGSHMANTAFDKHVAFCERYMSVIHEEVGELFRQGATSKATESAIKLASIRREFAAWIPRSVALKLEPFENALFSIGTDSHLVSALESTDRPARLAAIQRSYAKLMNVLGLKGSESDPQQDPDIASENVKERVRNILGINELTEMREFIIRKSMDFMRANP